MPSAQAPQLALCADNDAAYWQSWFAHPSTSVCSKLTESYALARVGQTIAMACKNGAGERTCSRVLPVAMLSFAVLRYAVPHCAGPLRPVPDCDVRSRQGRFTMSFLSVCQRSAV